MMTRLLNNNKNLVPLPDISHPLYSIMAATQREIPHPPVIDAPKPKKRSKGYGIGPFRLFIFIQFSLRPCCLYIEIVCSLCIRTDPTKRDSTLAPHTFSGRSPRALPKPWSTHAIWSKPASKSCQLARGCFQRELPSSAQRVSRDSTWDSLQPAIDTAYIRGRASLHMRFSKKTCSNEMPTGHFLSGNPLSRPCPQVICCLISP